MILLRLALRNLLRRPARSLLLIGSIALAVATALSLLALSRGIQASAHAAVNERGADLLVSQKDASDVFSGFIDEALLAKAAAVPGVIGVNGELDMFAPVDEGNEFIVFGWAPSSYLWPTVPIASGSLPKSDERGFALIGGRVAEQLGKGAGDTLILFDRTFRIAAVTGYQEMMNRSLVIVPLADLQELAFRDGQVTVMHLLLEPGLSEERIREVGEAVEKLGNVIVTPTNDSVVRDRNLKIFNAVANAILIIAVATGGLSVLNVLLMAVQERTRETGILMAIGWSRGRIMSTILAEGALLGLAGCLVGVPLGYAVCSLFNRLPTIGDYISFEPSATVILPAIGAGLLLTVGGSLYPAWRAVSQTPAAALRRA